MAVVGHSADQARERGLEQLFRAKYAGLVRALGPAFGATEAADAVQEAFVQAYLHWRDVSEYDNPVAWVRRVAIRRLLDGRRSSRRRERALVRLTTQGPWSMEPTMPDIDLATAIRRLPPRQRLAVVLFYLGDLSVAEVADAMRISDGAVKFHLHRGRRALEAALEVSHHG